MRGLFLTLLILPALVFADKVFIQKRFVTNGSLGAVFHSSAVDMNAADISSVTAVWTGGTANGSIYLEVSNDLTNPPVTWSSVSGSTSLVVGAGDFGWSISPMPYRWLRLAFDQASGTGVLNAITVIKGSGEVN